MKNLNKANVSGLRMNVMKGINYLIIFGLLGNCVITSVSAVGCDTDTFLYIIVNKDGATVSGATVKASVDGVVVDTQTTDNGGEATLIVPMNKFPDDLTSINVFITASVNGQEGSTTKTTQCGMPPDVSPILVRIISEKGDFNKSVKGENTTYYNESKEYCGDNICNGIETYEICPLDCKKPENKTETKPETKPDCLTGSDCPEGKSCTDGKCVEKPIAELKISAPLEVKEGGEFTVTATSDDNPVSEAVINYGGKTKYTDIQGKVAFTGISGETIITAEKEGYAKASASLQITTITYTPPVVNEGCKKDIDCSEGQTCKEGVCGVKTTNWDNWLIILAILVVIALLILWLIWKRR